MFPGAQFRYESCCPLPTMYGTMKGSFRMKRLDGSEFDAVVPEFEFVLPEVYSNQS